MIIKILEPYCCKTGILRRFKHSASHWSVARKKIKSTDKALSHFDDFYKTIFQKNWPGIREGLLSKQKYVAVVNNFSDNEETAANLEKTGAINIRTLFKLEKESLWENQQKRSRQKALDKIFQLDRQLEENKEKQSIEEEKAPQSDFSLKNSLEKAEIDRGRIVDSKNVLSSEILQEFVPATKILGKEDFIPESQHYEYYNQAGNFHVDIEKQLDFHFPPHLNLYCYEEENFTHFEPARTGSTGVLNYYLMDGGSVLPVLALDLQPGDHFLDMCAAPGGKSLLALQTLYPDLVVANDVSLSRTNRIYRVFHQFLYDFEKRWLQPERIKITLQDGRNISKDNYDKVLVDVPCTNDRHSLKEEENNIFRASRIKERIQLPELQAQLLKNALKLVKKGGIVVYSTCSLSPIQNDGVVHMALKQIWEETKIEFVVMDLSPALLQTCHVLKWARRKILKFGHLVLPCVGQNYGPTYFCKLQRVK